LVWVWGKVLSHTHLLTHAWEKETLRACWRSLCLVFEFNEDKKKACLIRLSQTASND